MMLDAIVIWDDEDEFPSNTVHIAEHGLSQEEVENVILNDDLDTEFSNSSGRPSKFGWTLSGKFIMVAFEIHSDAPMLLYPVTAYEVDP